jgi:hypothetical protein
MPIKASCGYRGGLEYSCNSFSIGLSSKVTSFQGFNRVKGITIYYPLSHIVLSSFLMEEGVAIDGVRARRDCVLDDV